MPDPCLISYIPDRLKTRNRPIVAEFEVGENLYYRCKSAVIDNPYKEISITELSHNRSGHSESVLCNPDDVLYSIKPEEDFEKYPDLEICTLQIIDLNPDGGYRKIFSQEKNGEEVYAVMELLHEPEPCMYPHCVFRVWLNEEVITYKNYKSTLQKVNKIRNRIKEELASMIRKREVSQANMPSEH